MNSEELQTLMNSYSQKEFGRPAEEVLASIARGELPNSLAASHLKMLSSLFKYGGELESEPIQISNDAYDELERILSEKQIPNAALKSLLRKK